MTTPEYFDFHTLAAEVGFTEEQVKELFQRTLDEHRGDRMMAELRMLRTCSAVAKGFCTVEEALAPDTDPSSRLHFRVAEDEPPYGRKS